MSKSEHRGQWEFFGIWVPAKGIFVVLLFILALVIGSIFAGATWGTVPTGNASVIVNTWDNTIKVGPMGPIDRPFLKTPFLETVVPIYIAVESVHMCSGYDSNLVETPGNTSTGCDVGSPIAITKDQIRLAIDMNVLWTLNPQPDKLINLYRNYPSLDYSQRVIIPTIRQVVRDVIVNRTFDEVFAQREILSVLISQEIVTKILGNPTLQGILVINPDSIQVLNIHMPQSIQDSLQARKNSEIAIITAQNQRNATIINADAQRQQQILQAEGLAQAKLISANATEKSITEVLRAICPPTNTSCTQQAGRLYLTLLQYQEIAKTGPNVLFIVGQTNGSPFIYQLPTKTNSTGGK